MGVSFQKTDSDRSIDHNGKRSWGLEKWDGKISRLLSADEIPDRDIKSIDFLDRDNWEKTRQRVKKSSASSIG